MRSEKFVSDEMSSTCCKWSGKGRRRRRSRRSWVTCYPATDMTSVLNSVCSVRLIQKEANSSCAPDACEAWTYWMKHEKWKAANEHKKIEVAELKEREGNDGGGLLGSAITIITPIIYTQTKKKTPTEKKLNHRDSERRWWWWRRRRRKRKWLWKERRED